ncbi:hypothetical protein F5876DRAFT_78780 [Lentinula aff. lateritia]|uniref:Uncharacterized protein n=1 Tax=Lentinula aff. lateritia TaxID=2804960 RepID=A0ACC1TVL6_9AGAR|nr:hypothetical protein F5876DRAFT_78780 [Lentinula aff. lateritia]
MLHIPSSASSSSTPPGSYLFSTTTHMRRVVEESAGPRYLLNEPPDSNREERQRRPILSLYIPQTTHDSGFEGNRTPRPHSARLVRSVRSGHWVAENSHVSPAPASQNQHLPVEILTDIFLNCLPTIHDTPPPRLTDQAPLLFLAVCREWRLIVLNTPRLWSSPHIRIPPPASMNSMSLKRQLDGIDLWLRRSGSTIPMTVSLMFYRGLKHSDSGWEEVHPNTLKLIRSLMCHSHRITRLGIFSLQTMHHLLRSLSIMSTIQLPALKSIYVRLAAQQRGLMSGEVLTDLMSHSHKSMPILQELHIDGLASCTARQLIRIRNWSSNITQLILGPSSSSSCCRSGLGSYNGHNLGPCDALSILSRNPQLQSFEATVTLHTHRSCTSFANLPFLLNLIIHFEVPPNDALISYPDQDIYRFFEYISCPGLRALSVAYAGIPSLTEVPFLSWLNASFNKVSDSSPGMKRTMCVDQLRDLKLEVSMTPEALTECLILLPPSVRVLEIVDLGHIDVEGVGVVDFGHTVQDSHLELLTWQILTPNSVNESVKDIDVSCSSLSSSLAASAFVSDFERGHDICPRLKTFRLVISGFLTSLCSTPTSRSSSTSSLHSPHQLSSGWRRRRSGVSCAALQRFIESRKQTGLQSSGPSNFRKKLLRECEVLLSPALSGSYLLDSPGL